METSNFVTQFHNLEGDLIAERKKNFFKLLKAQPASLNEDDLENLHPRTYLESLFQIEIFIYFKISSKLLDVIKGGNEVFISKILKHPLVLKEAIGNVSPESFVNDFLPCTSYAIRMKILKKISFYLSEDQMDEIVSAVHERYGFNIAINFLHTCSSNKIREYLSNHEVMLKPRQIKFIFDKDPVLLLEYLNYYKALTGNVYDHEELCKYVALKNRKLWLQLQKEDTLVITRLGRRTSKHFITDSNTDFSNNVKYYLDFLKLDIAVRKLQGNFKEVYFQMFPKNKEDVKVHNFCHKLLKYYPRKGQWNLFAQTFMRAFGTNVLDNLVYLDSSFKGFFPNKAVMHAWAEAQYNKEKSNSMLAYWEVSKVIPLIKEKINITSDKYDRMDLILILLQNCAENDDFTSLEQVLQYICFRHRNEENITRILEKIKFLFPLEKLNENHWKCVNELITILRLRKQLTLYFVFNFNLKYIEFLILHEKPFKKEFVTFMKDVLANTTWFFFSLKNPAIEKQIWTEIVNTYPEIVEDTDEKHKNWEQRVIELIIDFNTDNPKYSIDLSQFPRLVLYLKAILDRDPKHLDNDEKEILTRVINYNYKYPEWAIIKVDEAQIMKLFWNNKENFNFKDALIKIVRKSNRSKFENEVLQFFWENLLDNSSIRKLVINWLFVNEPRSIVPHFSRLLTIDKACIKLAHIKLMSHLNLDKIAIDHCISKLECLDALIEKYKKNIASGTGDIESDETNKIEIKLESGLIEVLSVLLSTKEYVEFVEKRLLPFKEKIETTDEELNQIYSLHCEVAKSFRRAQEPAVALPTVMKFCVGDYLQSALRSLYSVCYRAPEKLVYSYMDQLSKRAVSARKHALFLSCEVLSCNYALNLLRNSNQSNISSQKHIFSATLKYFRKNPCDDLLNQVATNLNSIDKNDEETLSSLVKIKIPKKYKTLYIQKCWYFFESLREKEVDVQNYLKIFLKSINESQDILMSLPVDFTTHVIRHYFKSAPKKDYNLDDIYRFVCLFTRYHASEQTFKFVFNVLSHFKNHKDTESIKTFFNNFYDIAIDDIKNNSKIDVDNNYHIEFFKQHWSGIFTPIEMFDEHVLLNLLYLICKSSDNFIESYAKQVVIYLEQLVAEYGPYIYYKFKDLVLYKNPFSNEKEKHLFLYNILKFKCSVLSCILVLDLLKPQCKEDDVRDVRNEIIKILKNSDDAVVSVYLNSKFGYKL